MKCPVCDKDLSPHRSFGDVQVDLCKEHGIWLDKGELTKIAESIRSDERESVAAEGPSERQSGRWEGIFFGIFSLLLPK